jgi:hypothetical protein
MITLQKRVIAIFVGKSSRQWVVWDADGHFWLLPAGDDPWDHRQSFDPTEETDLKLIPGHYTDMLDLPF